MERARKCPSLPAIGPGTPQPSIVPAACSQSPSCVRLRLGRLTDERVVKPPRSPSIAKCRMVEPAKTRPSEAVKVAKKPMMNEPETFTTKVPQGKVSPKRRAATPEHQ